MITVATPDAEAPARQGYREMLPDVVTASPNVHANHPKQRRFSAVITSREDQGLLTVRGFRWANEDHAEIRLISGLATLAPRLVASELKLLAMIALDLANDLETFPSSVLMAEIEAKNAENTEVQS